jgi:RNA-directed DNA polymerase
VRPPPGDARLHEPKWDGFRFEVIKDAAICGFTLRAVPKTGAWVKQMLQGHLNYYAVSGNHPSPWWFCKQVRWLWLKSLKRRSHNARLTWETFIRLVDRFFPPIRVLHPLPSHRFDARTRGRSPVR